jgi:hypothetical protein
VVGAATAVTCVRRDRFCALGVDVHGDTWVKWGSRAERRECGGGRQFNVLGQCGRARKCIGSPTVWRMWGGGRSFSRRSVKHLVN